MAPPGSAASPHSSRALLGSRYVGECRWPKPRQNVRLGGALRWARLADGVQVAQASQDAGADVGDDVLVQGRVGCCDQVGHAAPAASTPSQSTASRPRASCPARWAAASAAHARSCAGGAGGQAAAAWGEGGRQAGGCQRSSGALQQASRCLAGRAQSGARHAELAPSSVELGCPAAVRHGCCPLPDTSAIPCSSCREPCQHSTPSTLESELLW